MAPHSVLCRCKKIVNCYMESDWNHVVTGVDTSGGQLTRMLVAKLSVKRLAGFDEFHMVMAEDGPTGCAYSKGSN